MTTNKIQVLEVNPGNEEANGMQVIVWEGERPKFEITKNKKSGKYFIKEPLPGDTSPSVELVETQENSVISFTDKCITAQKEGKPLPIDYEFGPEWEKYNIRGVTFSDDNMVELRIPRVGMK